MQTIRFLALGLGVALSVVPDGSATAAPDTARDQVWAAEVAFARTMADRNAQAFAEFYDAYAVKLAL